MNFRKTLLVGLGLVTLCVFADFALAAELVVDFRYKLQHEDGTPVPESGPGSIASAKVEWGTCTGINMDEFGTVEGAMVVPYPQARVKATVTPGVKCARGYAITVDDVQSDPPSNLGRYFPEPLAVVAKTSSRIAYELRRKVDGDYQFVSVGTVPLDVLCGKRVVGSYYMVSGAKITKPLAGGVIAAKCN